MWSATEPSRYGRLGPAGRPATGAATAQQPTEAIPIMAKAARRSVTPCRIAFQPACSMAAASTAISGMTEPEPGLATSAIITTAP
jgi:hypothetical protein